jgi:hypothetical protein
MMRRPSKTSLLAPAARSALTAILCVGSTAAGLALGACAESAPAAVTAPVGPAAPATDSGAPPLDAASTLATAADPPRSSGPSDQGDAGAPARFRACGADADCVAVPRVGCCHNGWNEAIAASRRDAYAASFTCPEAHPICAMFIVHDTRKARCPAASHLCTLIAE